jgi:hypothetical protein
LKNRRQREYSQRLCCTFQHHDEFSGGMVCGVSDIATGLYPGLDLFASRTPCGSFFHGCVATTGKEMNLNSGLHRELRVPRLLSFLGLHMATGLAIGVLVASAMILTNLAGLKDLLVEAQEPVVAIFLLYAFNALTFGSVSMGIAVMTLPYDGTCDMRDPDDGDDDLGPRSLRARESKRSANAPASGETGSSSSV